MLFFLKEREGGGDFRKFSIFPFKIIIIIIIKLFTLEERK